MTREEAGKALDKAVEDWQRADEGEGLLMEYVLVTASHVARGDGSTATSVSFCCSDDLPLYRSIGLLDFALAQQRVEITRRDDDD